MGGSPEELVQKLDPQNVGELFKIIGQYWWAILALLLLAAGYVAGKFRKGS